MLIGLCITLKSKRWIRNKSREWACDLVKVEWQGWQLMFWLLWPKWWRTHLCALKKIVIMFCQIVVIWLTILLFFPLYVSHAKAMNPKVCKISWKKKHTSWGEGNINITDSTYILTTFWNLLSRNMMISCNYFFTMWQFEPIFSFSV